MNNSHFLSITIYTLFLFFYSYNVKAFEEKNNLKIQKLYKEIKTSHPDVREITLKDFKENKDDYLLVDVRNDNEFNTSHIPGALNKKYFLKNIEKYENQKIVFYCTIGYRSAKFIQKIQRRKLGIKAYNLEGSILGWVNNNGTVINNEQEVTNKVHVYGRKWKLLPKKYKAVTNWFN